MDLVGHYFTRLRNWNTARRRKPGQRSFSLDDDKDVVSEDVPDIDNFATSQPEDKKAADDEGDE